MLKSISRLDAQSASGALAGAILQLIGSQLAPATDAFAHLHDAIIRDAREKLGLAPDDDRPAAIKQIRGVLSKEADRILLGSTDQQAILSKLGNMGVLPLGIYEVRGTDAFRTSHEKLRTAKDCIIHCDDFEHLTTDDDHNERQWSLFSRAIRSPSGVIVQFHLAQAWREGSVLNVSRLWRIAPKFVTLQPTTMNLLQNFVDEYGIDLHVGLDTKAERLVLNRNVDGPDLDLGITTDEPGHFQLETLMKSTIGGFYIRIAYAIDASKYEKDAKILRARK